MTSEEFICINDMFADCLTRYDHYDKNRKVSTLAGMSSASGSSPNPSRDTSSKVITSKVAISRTVPPVPVPEEPSKPTAAPSLIDLEETAVSSGMKNLGNHLPL